MEFSVVVKSSGKPPTGEWDDLERFLRSARISPAVLHQLTPGKAHILKKRLSYEQALKISDRLADFGLSSAVTPPTKPESKPRLTTVGPAALSVVGVSTAAPAKVPAREASLAGSAASKAPGPTTGHAAPSPSVQRASPKAITDEIKSMFTLPPGKVNVTLPRAHRLRTRLLALRGLSFGALIAASGAMLAMSCMALIALSYVFLAGISPVLALLLLPLPTVLVVAALISLAIPLWFNTALPACRLTNKEHPRLVLLTTAVCKIFGAPVPGTFVLTTEPRISAEYRWKSGSLLRLRAPLEGEVVVYLGMPLLARLDIRELAALLAGECGRLADTTVQRSYALALQQHRWSVRHLTFVPLQDRFTKLDEQLAEGRLTVVGRLVAAADRLQDMTCRTLQSYHRRLGALLNEDARTSAYQSTVLSEEPKALREKVDRIASDRESALENARISGDLYLPNSLSHLLPASDPGLDATLAAKCLVHCREPARSLLSNFADADQAITRNLYQAIGIRLESVVLISGTELQQRKLNAVLFDKAAREYFGPWFDHRQFWILPPANFASRTENKITLSRLNHCISRIRHLSPERGDLLTSFSRIRQQITELDAAKLVIASGHRYKFKHSPGLGRDQIDKRRTVLNLRLGEIREELHQQNSTMGERLALGLALHSRHRTLTGKLHDALLCLSELADKTKRLEEELGQLETMNDYHPKTRVQQYQIHLDELKQSVANLQRTLRRKCQQCPFDFFDRRFPTLDAFLEARLKHRKAHKEGGEPELITNSRILLQTIQEAYAYSSKIAAYFAAQMEKKYGVDTVRRI